ncbi:MAG: M43 family zinc metalloprotease [Chitinophagales bacterium]
METKYPGYTEAVNKTFEAAKARGKEYRLNGRVDVLTVPVVVHVVWNTSDSSQNLADSIIEDQIRILNEDYRRLNADAGNIRSEFEDIVGDAFIEFELDEIIRVSTTEEFEPGLTGLDDADAVKISAEGGSDAVDPLTNLNIWICEIQPITLLGIPIGEILGYAYPPANLVHWPDGSQAPIVAKEGVVLDYRTVGSNNPTSVHFENNGFTIVGRTAVHEVGHYLGLRHIWGDANALLGENGCEVDDGIYDTPNAAASNQQNGCNPSTNSCGASSANDLPDMWENYMDYSQEDCQNSFTLGQIDVLRGVLLCPRAGLLDPNDSPIDLPQTSIPVGPSSVPANGTVSYVAANSSNEFIWEVTGGTINSGQGTNTVQVTWGNSNPAFICLRESNGTCTGLPFCELVTINASCSTPTTGTITGNQNATTTTTEAYTVANSG